MENEMTYCMNIDQEQVMRGLYAEGVCLAKAKAFAIHASRESFDLIFKKIIELDNLLSKLEGALPDESEEDPSKSPQYFEKAKSIIRLFHDRYNSEITNEEYISIRNHLI